MVMFSVGCFAQSLAAASQATPADTVRRGPTTALELRPLGFVGIEDEDLGTEILRLADGRPGAVEPGEWSAWRATVVDPDAGSAFDRAELELRSIPAELIRVGPRDQSPATLDRAPSSPAALFAELERQGAWYLARSVHDTGMQRQTYRPVWGVSQPTWYSVFPVRTSNDGVREGSRFRAQVHPANSGQLFAQARLWAQARGAQHPIPPPTRVSSARGRPSLLHEVWTVWDWGAHTSPTQLGEEYVPVGDALGLRSEASGRMRVTAVPVEWERLDGDWGDPRWDTRVPVPLPPHSDDEHGKVHLREALAIPLAAVRGAGGVVGVLARGLDGTDEQPEYWIGTPNSAMERIGASRSTGHPWKLAAVVLQQ